MTFYPTHTVLQELWNTGDKMMSSTDTVSLLEFAVDFNTVISELLYGAMKGNLRDMRPSVTGACFRR